MNPVLRKGVTGLLLLGAMAGLWRSFSHSTPSATASAEDCAPCSACSILAKQARDSVEHPGTVPESVAATLRKQRADAYGEAGLMPPAQELWKIPAPEPALAAFQGWTERYAAADAASRAALVPEGVTLATARRQAMADLITANPERALQRVVPWGVRQDLPPEITSLLETRVTARGDYEVSGVLPVPGKADALPPMVREAVIDGVRYQVSTFGAGLAHVTKADVPLNGIALPADAGTNPPDSTFGVPDALMALDPSPVRVLDDAELAASLTDNEETPVCTESGSEITVNDEASAFQLGPDIHYYCGSMHLLHTAASAIAGAGLDNPDGLGDLPVAESGYTEGSKRFLFLRVKFTDGSYTISESAARTLLGEMVTYMSEMSYDRLRIAPEGTNGSAITPELPLANPASYYDNAGLSKLYPDAKKAATAAGYTLGNYDFLAVFTTGKPAAGYAGLAYVGGIGIHIANGYFGKYVLAHELGHNLGLPHAHSWDTGDKSIIGDGSNVEYGNNYDPIGSGNGQAHYIGSHKNYLDWIPDADATRITAGGIYRLYAMDNIYGDQGRRTLRVGRGSSQDYWFDLREDYTDTFLKNGLMLHFANRDGRESYLLDSMPKVGGVRTLLPGMTFEDPVNKVRVTPLGRTDTYPSSMDVAVYFNTAGNRAPTGVLTSHSPNVQADVAARFTVEASDPDGHDLAFFWDFGDGTFSMDNLPDVTHTWSGSGEYVVQVTVSDMRGGTWRDSAIIQVGNPSATQYRISGVVQDTAHQPLPGVRVYVDSTHYAWTDSDGSYVLTRLGAGSQTVKVLEPVEAVLNFLPTGPNPVTVGPSRENVSFVVASESPEAQDELVAKLSTWKYFATAAAPAAGWQNAGFADTSWPSGPGMLGYGNGGEGTVIPYGGDGQNKWTTAYFRKTFNVTDPSVWTELRLLCQRDDGVIVYLNGTEIFRDNLPAGTVTYSTGASDTVEPDGYLTTSGLATSLLHAGTNTIAAEVHQVEPTSSDLAFDLQLLGIRPLAGAGAAAVWMTGPPDGGEIRTPVTSVPLTAGAAASNAAVTQIEFYVDGVKAGQDTAAPWQATWLLPQPGPHSLHAVATFAGGTTLTSPPMTVTVSAPPDSLIPAGATWRWYASKTAAPPANWNQRTFSDAAWSQGPAQLGYGDGDEATAISGGIYPTAYFRHSFSVADPAAWPRLLARMIRDDAAVVWLNGREVWRSNYLAGTGATWTPQAAGANAIENDWHSALLDSSLLVPGMNVIAVAVEQNTATSSDLSFDFALEGSGGPAPRSPGVYLTAPAAVTQPSVPVLHADVVPEAGRSISNVTFYANGALIGADTSYPYELTWSGAAPGPWSVTANALDSTGVITVSAAVAVTVSPVPPGTALVSFSERWRYLDTGVDPGTNWTARTGFDDSSWPEGPGRLGYGGDGEVTALTILRDNPKPVTAWFRRKFTSPAPGQFQALRLRLVRDDGAAVYLNGREIFRSNLPDGTLSFATLASATADAASETTPVEIVVPVTGLLSGENQLAVEVHQAAVNSSDLGFDLELTGLPPTPSGAALWLSSPAGGAIAHPLAGLPLTVGLAESTGAVSAVEFYAGNAKIGQATTAPWSFTWATPLNGSYPVKARALLAAGGAVDSAPVAITVGAPATTEVLIPAGSTWKYLPTNTVPPAGWTGTAYSDTAWLAGAGRLGFGDTQTTELTSGALTYYFRHSFSVPDALLEDPVLRMQRDDGALVYVNGVLVARLNMPAGAVSHSTLASSAIGGADETAWIDVPVSATAFRPGQTNVIAVEMHQSAANSSDLGFDLELSISKRAVAGLVNTVPATAPVATLIASGVLGESARLTLEFPETNGRVYVIETSADLVTWTPLSTHIVTGGNVSAPLPAPTADAAFYRARWSAAP